MEKRLNGHPLGCLLSTTLGQVSNFFRIPARPWNQDLSVSNVAFDASPKRSRPDAQFRFGRVPALLRQSLRNVSHGLGVGSPLRETIPPIHGIHRAASRSEATILSTALLSCFRVTICVRGVSAIPESASPNKRVDIFHSGEEARSER